MSLLEIVKMLLNTSNKWKCKYNLHLNIILTLNGSKRNNNVSGMRDLHTYVKKWRHILEIHQSFQQDLVRLRLTAARDIIAISHDQSATGNEKEQVKLSAQVKPTIPEHIFETYFVVLVRVFVMFKTQFLCLRCSDWVRHSLWSYLWKMYTRTSLWWTWWLCFTATLPCTHCLIIQVW